MSELSIERLCTNSGLKIYTLHCRMYRNMIGRVQVIPELAAVIDTGSEDSSSREDILSGFRRLNTEYGETITPSAIRHVLLTHGHIDHIGGLPLFNNPDVKYCLHREDCLIASHYQAYFLDGMEKLEEMFRIGRVPQEFHGRLRQIFLTMGPRTINYNINCPVEDRQELILGSTPVKVVSVPGHSRGQVNYQLDNVLFTGDHILSQTMAPIWPRLFCSSYGYKTYLNSLSRVNELVESNTVDTFLPSHEQTIFDPLKRLSVIHSAQERRFRKIRAKLEDAQTGSEPLTSYAWEIANTIYAAPSDYFQFIGLLDVFTRLEYLQDY